MFVQVDLFLVVDTENELVAIRQKLQEGKKNAGLMVKIRLPLSKPDWTPQV